jgi:hypothetical protein
MITGKRVAWLNDRLRTMGPAEVISRLADIGRHLTLCASLNQVKRRNQKISVDNGYQSFNVLKQKGELDGIPMQVGEGIIAGADEWLEHRASFFGLQNVPLGDPIDWHRDYAPGLIGPMKYSGFINHRDVALTGNIKYIWELTRLHHLVLLSLALLSTENCVYGDEIVKQVRSWRTNNPFMKGVNWKSPLEAGIRLISWAYVSFLTTVLNDGEGICHEEIRDLIYQHQSFIRKFHSRHSSANNHLIGEMAGLYVASAFWPWYRESASWRKFARKKLIEEIYRQVEDDGVGKERATEYQIFILELFFLAGALGQAIGEPFPPEYWDRLKQMLTFLSAISDRAGNIAMFGDGDSAQVLGLAETTRECARALVDLGQFRERTALESDVRPFLLMWGQKKEEIPLAPVQRPEHNVQVFPQGGYYVLATDRGLENEILVVFDAGPIGLPPLNAHGHADALSFWLSYGGQEFLIDPGTFCYNTSSVWRSYFRGTTAHNTVRIDGQDQSISGDGPFLWRHVAHCQAERVEENGDFVEVEGFHDGYRRLVDPVIHRRNVRLYKRSPRLVITDRVECHEGHEIELFFHFSERAHVQQVGLGRYQISNGNRGLTLRLLDPRLKVELYRGSENPILGWVSRTFDVKEPSFTLAARITVTGSTQFLTEITAL